MSRLEELIAKYCPNGVEYKKLCEVTQISAGGDLPRNYAKGQKTPTEKYPYPIYSNGTGDGALYGFTDNYKISKEAVTISARGTIGYHEARAPMFTPIVRLITLIADESKLVTKFLHYALYIAKIEGVTTGIPSLTVPMLEKSQIPLPPLPVQEEIVRILDKFTALEAELEAELEARKKQYEYYRSSLLNSTNSSYYSLLSMIADYSDTRIDSIELNKSNYVGVDNLLQDKRGKTSSNYVPTEGRFTEYLCDDILLGNIRPYLKKIWLATNRGGTNGDVLVIRIKQEYHDMVIPRFVYHLLSSEDFFLFNIQNSKGAKMPRGSKQAIINYSIPLPPLAEQTRIVAILDRFDILVNDISQGLPAEIEARRKQYEYYRNQLLTFKEATS